MLFGFGTSFARRKVRLDALSQGGTDSLDEPLSDAGKIVRPNLLSGVCFVTTQTEISLGSLMH